MCRITIVPRQTVHCNQMINLACLSEKIHVQTSLLMPLLFISVKKNIQAIILGYTYLAFISEYL